MPARKQRVAVVLDTNVIIGRFLSNTPRSAINRLFEAWLVKRELQLILSKPVLEEYLEVMDQIGVSAEKISSFRQLLLSPLVTHINLGKRFSLERDPDDAILLATAHTGRAQFLVTQDRDLLGLSVEARRGLRFQIVTPAGLLRQMKQ